MGRLSVTAHVFPLFPGCRLQDGQVSRLQVFVSSRPRLLALSSPPPVLTLVFSSPSPARSAGTAAPRYSPTKTHMHFGAVEEEEEEGVEKRVCECAALAAPWPGPPAHLGRLGDRYGQRSKKRPHFFRCLQLFLCLKKKLFPFFSYLSNLSSESWIKYIWSPQLN